MLSGWTKTRPNWAASALAWGRARKTEGSSEASSGHQGPARHRRREDQKSNYWERSDAFQDEGWLS